MGIGLKIQSAIHVPRSRYDCQNYRNNTLFGTAAVTAYCVNTLYGKMRHKLVLG